MFGQPNFVPFGGIHIVWSEHCLEETNERLFPESRHRSKRIRKKLMKRFGGEFRKVPAIFKTPQGFVAHPALRSKLDSALSQGPTP